MKMFTGWVLSAGLMLAATSANAQMLAPAGAGDGFYSPVSDFSGPYAAMPPDAALPGYDGPRLLPASEVYTVLRENGFSPLGIPRQRGVFYSIAVINRGGEDGRLVIDARDGRIVRFVPDYRVGSNYDEGLRPVYGRGGPLPSMNPMRSSPRPPASVPHVASRTPAEPLRKAPPRTAEPPVAARPNPTPATQSAAIQPKAAEAAKMPQNTAPAPTDAKPAPQIQPTQEMPKAQGLE